MLRIKKAADWLSKIKLKRFFTRTSSSQINYLIRSFGSVSTQEPSQDFSTSEVLLKQSLLAKNTENKEKAQIIRFLQETSTVLITQNHRKNREDLSALIELIEKEKEQICEPEDSAEKRSLHGALILTASKDHSSQVYKKIKFLQKETNNLDKLAKDQTKDSSSSISSIETTTNITAPPLEISRLGSISFLIPHIKPLPPGIKATAPPPAPTQAETIKMERESITNFAKAADWDYLDVLVGAVSQIEDILELKELGSELGTTKTDEISELSELVNLQPKYVVVEDFDLFFGSDQISMDEFTEDNLECLKIVLRYFTGKIKSPLREYNKHRKVGSILADCADDKKENT